jgi:uncharacterized protein YeaO (DUF488 family)
MVRKELLAPSRKLWKKYVKEKNSDWSEYSRQYIEQIKDKSQAMQLLHHLAFFVNDKSPIMKPYLQLQQEQQKIYTLIQKHRIVTLLWYCKYEKFLDRPLLKTYTKLSFAIIHDTDTDGIVLL